MKTAKHKSKKPAVATATAATLTLAALQPGLPLQPSRAGGPVSAANEAHAGRGQDNPLLACAMGALNPAERQRHGELLGHLRTAITARRELADGFSFDLEAEKLPLTELAEWIGLERRCCPFFGFRVETRPGEEDEVRLDLTGGGDVKAFIQDVILAQQS